MNDKVSELVEWAKRLIDRDKDEKEWPNTQLIIEHLSDILTTAEEHHDSRGNSTQTLYRMDLDRIAQAIDILKSRFTHLHLEDSIKEMK